MSVDTPQVCSTPDCTRPPRFGPRCLPCHKQWMSVVPWDVRQRGIERQCTECGKMFGGQHYAKRCPECRRTVKDSSATPLNCEQCGVAFEHRVGGQQPKRCPECRRPATNDSNRRWPLVRVGSELTCVDCQAKFVRDNPGQVPKRCPSCREHAENSYDKWARAQEARS